MSIVGRVPWAAQSSTLVPCMLLPVGYNEISFHLLTNVFSHLQAYFPLCHFHLRDAGVFPQSPELLVAEEATSLLLRHSFVNSKLLVLQLNSHLLLLFFLFSFSFLKKKWIGTSPNNQNHISWGPMESLLELEGHPVAKCPKMRSRVPSSPIFLQ